MSATAAGPIGLRQLLRHPWWDVVAILLSLVHGVVLLLVPSTMIVAVGMWWNANTIAHHAIHTPFFRRQALNRLYSAYLTLLIGVPQTLWRRRHLEHHFPNRRAQASGANRARPRAVEPGIWLESALLLVVWTIVVSIDWRFFAFTYLPGWVIGLALCQLHGYYEHAAGTTSHYGRLYNFLFFNDGLHVEHHASPSTHWSELRRAWPRDAARESRWPSILRWLDTFSLNGLERLVLRSTLMQRVMLETHARAFAALLPQAGAVSCVTIVGGGLFPRTPLVLRTLLPRARLTVLEADGLHLQSARQFLTDVDWRLETFEPGTHAGTEMLIVPLAYVGDRARLYADPPADFVIVHDWIWRPRGKSVVVAWWLFKRLNLVRRGAAAARPHRSAA